MFMILPGKATLFPQAQYGRLFPTFLCFNLSHENGKSWEVSHCNTNAFMILVLQLLWQATRPEYVGHSGDN
jgi:hypothetical protein